LLEYFIGCKSVVNGKGDIFYRMGPKKKKKGRKGPTFTIPHPQLGSFFLR